MSAKPQKGTAPSSSEKRTIILGHSMLKEVEVQIRRNRGGRNVRIHVDERGQIVVSVPMRFSVRKIDAIVKARAEWLYSMLESAQTTASSTVVDLLRGDSTLYLGAWIATRVQYLESSRANVQIINEGPDTFILISVPKDTDPLDTLLAWYRREAREIFQARASGWAKEFKLEYGKVSIREQKTRWGSCTEQGNLSFNWRLVLAPLWVLDAIVVHELCHIDELNHSDRFWAILDQRYPKHRAAQEWLKEHGKLLRISRPEDSNSSKQWPRLSDEQAEQMDLF